MATERVLTGLMIACSLIAILTTLGIVLSLLFEALRFFDRVSPLEFFFGLNWEPQIPIREGQVTAGGAFGAIPVFAGTLADLRHRHGCRHPHRASIRRSISPNTPIPRCAPWSSRCSNFWPAFRPWSIGFFAVLTVAPAMRDFGEMIGIPHRAQQRARRRRRSWAS